MNQSNWGLWLPLQKCYRQLPESDLALEIRRINFCDYFLAPMFELIKKTFAATNADQHDNVLLVYGTKLASTGCVVVS
jgi:hypothetical protein